MHIFFSTNFLHAVMASASGSGMNGNTPPVISDCPTSVMSTEVVRSSDVLLVPLDLDITVQDIDGIETLQVPIITMTASSRPFNFNLTIGASVGILQLSLLGSDFSSLDNSVTINGSLLVLDDIGASDTCSFSVVVTAVDGSVCDNSRPAGSATTVLLGFNSVVVVVNIAPEMVS